MKRRHCLKCNGHMRPTRKMGTFSPDLRFFRCTDCGFESEWVDKPEMDGSHGELHRVNKGYITTSMQSDPTMSYGEEKKNNRRRRKARRR